MAKSRKAKSSKIASSPTSLSAHSRWQHDVEVLQNTLFKIKSLNPVLGGKWQRGMIKYYEERLIELSTLEPEL